MSIYNSSYLLENGYIALDEAKYNGPLNLAFAADDPYFAKYKKELALADQLLKDKNIKSISDADKRMETFCKLIQCISAGVHGYNVGRGLGKAVLNAVQPGLFGPASMVLNAAIALASTVLAWAAKSGNEKLYIKHGERIIKELDKLAKTTDDEKLKEKAIKQKEKFEKELEAMKKGVEDTKLFKK